MNYFESYEMELYSAKRCSVYFAERCKLLEQLCRRMYKGHWHYFAEAPGRETSETQEARAIKVRMQELGLLDGKQNVKPLD